MICNDRFLALSIRYSFRKCYKHPEYGYFEVGYDRCNAIVSKCFNEHSSSAMWIAQCCVPLTGCTSQLFMGGTFFFFFIWRKSLSLSRRRHIFLKQSQDCSTCWMLLIYYDPLHTAIVPAITQIFTYRHWEVVSGVWRENKGRGSISWSLGNILGTRCLERERAEQNPCCFGWQTFTAGTTHVATRRQFQVVKWMGPMGQSNTDFPL